MNEIVLLHNGNLVTTQNIIAKYSKNSEESIQRLIRKHKDKLEVFGQLDYDEDESINSKNKINIIKHYYLNEKQAYLFMTFLKNTEIIIDFKVTLVEEFFEMKKQLENKSSNQPDLQKVISGLKSGMLRKDKKIERLENEIQQLKIEHQKRVAIPHFTQNQKIDIILRNTENLLKQDGILPFQDMAKVRFDFMRDYIEAIRTGGTKLEQFTINTIEDYKNKYMDESKRRVLVEHKYNLMIDKVREYIKVANQLSLLEPIGGDL